MGCIRPTGYEIGGIPGQQLYLELVPTFKGEYALNLYLGDRNVETGETRNAGCSCSYFWKVFAIFALWFLIGFTFGFLLGLIAIITCFLFFCCLVAWQKKRTRRHFIVRVDKAGNVTKTETVRNDETLIDPTIDVDITLIEPNPGYLPVTIYDNQRTIYLGVVTEQPQIPIQPFPIVNTTTSTTNNATIPIYPYQSTIPITTLPNNENVYPLGSIPTIDNEKEPLLS
eukprot:TRINITY_DN2634_c0_g1_i1.p1 TRINITY_DN2634_c0_g1~~TRINITY_DN2634_c0_g1_i1.p1  ORF type:complete len:227 (+),score=114.21 TRINITY_DN2634_c0_g1_i1:268-948(+)